MPASLQTIGLAVGAAVLVLQAVWVVVLRRTAKRAERMLYPSDEEQRARDAKQDALKRQATNALHMYDVLWDLAASKRETAERRDGRVVFMFRETPEAAKLHAAIRDQRVRMMVIDKNIVGVRESYVTDNKGSEGAGGPHVRVLADMIGDRGGGQRYVMYSMSSLKAPAPGSIWTHYRDGHKTPTFPVVSALVLGLPKSSTIL